MSWVLLATRPGQELWAEPTPDPNTNQRCMILDLDQGTVGRVMRVQQVLRMGYWTAV